MNVDIVLAPYDSGYHGKRMGAGPLRLLEAGFVGALSTAGHEARVEPVELEPHFPTEIASAFALAHSIKARVAAAVALNHLPIVLSGNCIAAVGAVAALGQPRVIWLDAHADLNTPDSTRSGFLDGMALSVLLGACWHALAADVGLTPIPCDRVCLIGTRDIDPAEQLFLDTSSVRRFAADSDVSSLHSGGEIYLHIDLDVLDPSVGVANQYSVAGGLTLDRLLTIVGDIAEHNRVRAVTLSAYDPTCDSSGAIATAACEIAGRDCQSCGGRACNRLSAHNPTVRATAVTTTIGWFQLPVSQGRFYLRPAHPSYTATGILTADSKKHEIITVVLSMGSVAIPLEPLLVTARSPELINNVLSMRSLGEVCIPTIYIDGVPVPQDFWWTTVLETPRHGSATAWRYVPDSAMINAVSCSNQFSL